MGIQELETEEICCVFQLLVYGIDLLLFGPEVWATRKYADNDDCRPWEGAVDRMNDCRYTLENGARRKPKIVRADEQQHVAWSLPAPIDGLEAP